MPARAQRLWSRSSRAADDRPVDDPARGAEDLLGRTVAAVVFDWDGTAVTDRRASARAVRSRLERLSALGVHAAVVSGTHLGNVDGQLRARPRGPGRLYLALNRGSELFEVASRPALLRRTEETAEVRTRLDRTAEVVAERLRGSGLDVAVVAHRLNRTKIDLVPEPAWADPPKARIAELVEVVTHRLAAAGYESLGDVAELARCVALEEGLPDPRITSDGKHLEVGVTDKGDSMTAVLERLAHLGVTGDLVLVVGDEFGPLAGLPGSDAHLIVDRRPGPVAVSVGVEPLGVPDGVRHLAGGPATFVALLDEQVRRAEHLRVPEVCVDERWSLLEPGPDPARHRVAEAILTLASNGIGWRGSTEDTADVGEPLVAASGVYAGPGVADGLLEGPDLADVRLTEPVRRDLRVLDLRTGVLHRAERGPAQPLRSMRFASIVEPGVFALRVEAGADRLVRGAGNGGPTWTAVATDRGGLGALAGERHCRDGGVAAVERLAAVDASLARPPARRAAEVHLRRASAAGFERLLSRQRQAWAARWARVGVDVPDDPTLELRLRFALFHLWNLSPVDGELAVGARSVTGTGYAGHVFWDADAFVLPALVTVDPAAAAAMVRYRLRRLGPARERARAHGHPGARFPWESGRDGDDVTPTSGHLGGEPVAIRTGELEEHITADVAWAVLHHAAWTRPGGALTRREAVLLRDTARYWASRVHREPDGTAHVRRVIGPDEYHEDVDDNAFTNVMARWNLRRAAERAHAPSSERASWSVLAAALVDGYDAATGRYEQFRGFGGLEPLLAGDVAEPPVAADVLLGRDGVARSQVIKQPDALMIHYLVPDEAAPGSLGPTLEHDGPRTAHGSSLSPAVMAYLHARAGQPDRALELLALALSIDLDDLGGTTSGGVHIAACAGAWRAVVGGFLGAAVVAGRLHLDPVLPSAWSALEARFRCLGQDVRVRVDGRRVQVDASGPLLVTLDERCDLPASTASDGVRLAGGGGPR